MDTKQPINLNLTIPQTSLKKIVESGRLAEFIDTLSSLAKAHITQQVIGKLTTAQAGGISVSVGFDDEPGYGTPPHHWPWLTGIYEDAMREKTIEVVGETAGE
jgi:hypothetical protein